MVHGPSHPWVVERLHLGIEEEVAGVHRSHPVQRGTKSWITGIPQCGDRVCLGSVDFPALDHHDPQRDIASELDVDRIHPAFGAGVVWIALEPPAHVPAPVPDLIRAGADQVGSEVGTLLADNVARQCGREHHREHVAEGEGGFRELDDQRPPVRRAQAGDVGCPSFRELLRPRDIHVVGLADRARPRIEDPFQREHIVFGLHFASVGEAHARLQVEGVCLAVRGNVPVAGLIGDEARARGVEIDQAAEEQLLERYRISVESDGRIERSPVLREPQSQRAAPTGCLGGREGSGGEQKQEQEDLRSARREGRSGRGSRAHRAGLRSDW